jgi:hypothetical protein
VAARWAHVGDAWQSFVFSLLSLVSSSTVMCCSVDLVAERQCSSPSACWRLPSARRCGLMGEQQPCLSVCVSCRALMCRFSIRGNEVGDAGAAALAAALSHVPQLLRLEYVVVRGGGGRVLPLRSRHGALQAAHGLGWHGTCKQQPCGLSWLDGPVVRGCMWWRAWCVGNRGAWR